MSTRIEDSHRYSRAFHFSGLDQRGFHKLVGLMQCYGSTCHNWLVSAKGLEGGSTSCLALQPLIIHYVSYMIEHR